MAEIQISAYISGATKEQLETYAEAHGIKKGHLVEEALLHHFQALRELPADLIVPPRIVVSKASFARIARLVSRPRRPAPALRKLMAKGRVRGATKVL